MNTRIKELESQCYEDRSRGYSTPYFNKEKFAELIIKDCFELMKEPSSVRDCIVAIEDYFGVKE